MARARFMNARSYVSFMLYILCGILNYMDVNDNNLVGTFTKSAVMSAVSRLVKSYIVRLHSPQMVIKSNLMDPRVNVEDLL